MFKNEPSGVPDQLDGIGWKWRWFEEASDTPYCFSLFCLLHIIYTRIAIAVFCWQTESILIIMQHMFRIITSGRKTFQGKTPGP